MARDPRISNLDEVEPHHEDHDGRFVYTRRSFTAHSGDQGLGCSHYELPPGARDFPYHEHWHNHEAIYVLDGQGTLRLAGQEHPLRKGDWVSLPAASDSAHQVINDSDAPLRYLCISTMRTPDVCHYPDSDKYMVAGGRAPGGNKREGTTMLFLPRSAAVDYHQGE